MAEYIETRLLIDSLETTAAAQLAEAINAYAWPESEPEPDRFDSYSVERIRGKAYGEDLTSELALAGRTTPATASYLVQDVTRLRDQLPGCWAKVITGEAPLWQARRISDAVQLLTAEQCATVDEMVAPSLGVVSNIRLTRLTDAAIRKADPENTRYKTRNSERFVRTGGSDHDPTTGWVYAHIDRVDAIKHDAIIDLIARRIAEQGDETDLDTRRARAFGILANPAAAVQLIGIPTTRGMNPEPTTPEQTQAILDQADAMAPGLTIGTKVYVHLYADTLTDPDALARIEGIGPMLMDQVQQITGGTGVRLAPVVHPDGAGICVDQYEIPTRVRDQVLAANPHCVFPWSATESRHLDLDHTIPYQPGIPGQTRPDNLGPLTRKAHRIKTHAGWKLTQPQPGVYIWTSPSGQVHQVDTTGTHRVAVLE